MTKNVFSMVRGSDVQRNGVFLELQDGGSAALAEIFFSDLTQKMTISLYQSDLPLEVSQDFIERAKAMLPPVNKG